MKRFCSFFVFLLAIGCSEQQQKIIRPVMDVVQDEPAADVAIEEPVEEDLAIQVDFSDVDVPPPPTTPEDLEILEDEQVYHISQEEWDESERNVFETATEAAASDVVLDFFDEVKVWMEENCGNQKTQQPAIEIYFTSRDERQKFVEALPGGYETGFFHLTDDRGDHWWDALITFVYIVDSTHVYFNTGLVPNNPCVNFR